MGFFCQKCLRGYGLAYHLTDKAPPDESTDGSVAKAVKACHTDDEG
jgi:hypothetical protein